jgi:formylglycine-generating enzyme required for sulfatase activity
LSGLSGHFELGGAWRKGLDLRRTMLKELSKLLGKARVGRQPALPKNWAAFLVELDDLRRRSSGLPKPIVETFNLTELENTISSGLAKAKKAEAEAQKLQRKRKRRSIFLYSSIMFSFIFYIIYYVAIAPWFAERQRTEAARLAIEKMKLLIGKPITVPSASIKMLWVPPGTFEISSSSGSSGKTPHTVTLTVGYWLGKHEVTQAQWQKVMGNNPSSFKGGNRPVETVSWPDVNSFCDKLSELERKAGRLPAGMAYQLPTEAQWEYACRAGTNTVYAFGDGLTSAHANISGGPGETTDVGKYPANAWGFHDMHGNVFEWCADWYEDYPTGNVTNPTGPAVGSRRVERGGSWDYSAINAPSATRHRSVPALSINRLGFRLSLRPASQ